MPQERLATPSYQGDVLPDTSYQMFVKEVVQCFAITWLQLMIVQSGHHSAVEAPKRRQLVRLVQKDKPRFIIGFARVVQCKLKPGLDQSERGGVKIWSGLFILDGFLRRGMKMGCHGIIQRHWLSISLGIILHI